MGILLFLIFFTNIEFIFGAACKDGDSFSAIGTLSCSTYELDSCCEATFVKETIMKDDGCRSTPDFCSQIESNIKCGINCKPNFITDYFNNQTNKFRICSSFWDDVQEKCKDLEFCPSNQGISFSSVPRKRLEAAIYNNLTHNISKTTDCLTDSTKCISSTVFFEETIYEKTTSNCFSFTIVEETQSQETSDDHQHEEGHEEHGSSTIKWIVFGIALTFFLVLFLLMIRNEWKKEETDHN